MYDEQNVAIKIPLDTDAALCYCSLIMSEQKRLNIKLDVETHRRLKLLAVSKDTTIQELLVHLIKQAVYQPTH